MVKIHWSAYIILSAVVLFVSYRIDDEELKAFIWLGYLFLVVGIAKLGIWFVRRNKESRNEIKEIKNELHENYPRQRAQQRAARYCIKCGAGLRGNENFCLGCGQRLR